MRTWIAVGIAVCSLLGANPALAQEGFSFASPADAAIGRDYGFLAGNQKLTDTIIVARLPRFRFNETSARRDFSVNYQPEIELFDNNRHLSTVNQTGAAGFTYRFSERMQFNATDDFLSTEDPTRSIPGILIFLPREHFTQNLAHAALKYGLTRRNALTTSFDNVTIGGRIRNAGSLSLAHAFKPKQIVTGTYSLLNGWSQFAGLAYDGEFRNDFNVHLASGLIEDNGQNYMISGMVDKRLGAVWSNGGYHRFISIFGTSISGGVPIGNELILPAGVRRNDVYQVVSSGLAGKLSNRMGVELGAAVTKNNSGTANRNINNATGRLKFDYSVAERLKVYTDLQFYSQSYNVFVGTPIDRRRYVAGIQYDLSSGQIRAPGTPKQTKPSDR